MPNDSFLCHYDDADGHAPHVHVLCRVHSDVFS